MYYLDGPNLFLIIVCDNRAEIVEETLIKQERRRGERKERAIMMHVAAR